MTDKPAIDSNYLEAMAFGVFDSAPDVDSGRAALLQAYDSYDWSDKAKANKILEHYGEQLKYKHKDQSEYDPKFLEESAPVKLSDIPLEDLKNDQDLYTKWDEANQAYLQGTDEPQYLVAKKQLSEDIKAHASSARRDANQENIKGNIGETAARAVDLSNRYLQGASAVVEPYVNSAVNVFTDGYELNSHLTELTDPKTDKSFLSDAANVAGNVSGTILAGSVGGAPGVFAAGATQGIDATGTRYQDTLNKTGDSSAATEAAVIEGGSQALQLVGEQVVFGKLANRIVGKAVTAEGKAALQESIDAGKTAVTAETTKYLAAPVESLVGRTVRGSGIEAFSEGSGQAISNVADNIETGKGTFNDLGRGVGRSALLGGLAAGGSEVAYHYLPSRANTNVRKDEIVENGFPVTPVTKQVVGDQRSGELNEDSIPAEDGLDTVDAAEAAPSTEPITNYSEEEQQSLRDRGLVKEENGVEVIDSEPTQESSDIDLTPNAINTDTTPEKVPAYTTEDDVQHYKTEEGHYVQDDTLPFDNTLFLNEETAIAVDDAIDNGEHIILDDKGLPVIERVSPTGEISHQPLEFSAEPSKGLYPLDISAQRYKSKQEKIRPVKLGKRIKEITVDMGMGAAGSRTFKGKETTYSEKLRNSGLPKPMQAVGEKGIYYEPLNIAELDKEIEGYIQENGIESVIKSLNEPSVLPQAKAKMRVHIHNFFEAAISQATQNGDFAEVKRLGNQFKEVAPNLTNTEAGQTLAASRGKNYRNGESVIDAFDNAYENSLVESGKAEGIDPLEIGQSDETVEKTTDAIQKTTDHVERLTNRDAVTLDPDDQALEDVVVDIETTAQTKLDKDLDSIEQETNELTTAVATTTKKAERQKRKDIAALENAVGKDSGDLTNALQDATDLKNITAEESQKLDEAIGRSLKEAETKANEEVAEEIKNIREGEEEDKRQLQKEESDQQKAIDIIVKKAERAKRKAIQALDGEVTKNNIDLTNALGDAAELKSITAEESQKLEEEIKRHTDQAEKKASAEVTKAVKETRANNEAVKKDAAERANERLIKATEDHATNKQKIQEQLKKYSLKKRELESTNQDTSAVDEKIEKLSEKITKSAQRVVDAKESLRELEERQATKTEADEEAENLLAELESGVEIRTTPVGKRRIISVKTKASGLDVTKLFNTKTEAYGPLSALSRSVNELAGTIKQSLGAKAGNNQRIADLQKRLNDNKKALDETKRRDALSDKESKQVKAAKKRLADLAEKKSAPKSEAEQESEKLLKELESGVEIKVTPVGKSRKISIKTKKSGMDVSKLFNSKSEARGPISALSRSVNELSGTIRQSLGAKAVSNDRITELTKRIKENKAALEKTKTRDALSAQEKAKIAAAKKRLQELDKAKAEATLESRIPEKTKDKYKKYKEKQGENKTKPKKQSPELLAAKKKLADLERAKARAEKLQEKKRLAEQAALNAAQEESGIQDEIQQLEEILNSDIPINVSKKNAMKATLAVLKGVNETQPERRDAAMRIWVSNLIGAPSGILVGTISSVITPVGVTLFKLPGSSVRALIGNIASGSLGKYKYPVLQYWKGMLDGSAYKRGYKAAVIALWNGERVETGVNREDVVARGVVKISSPTYQEQVRDYTNFAKSLEYNKVANPLDALKNIAVAAQKFTGFSSGKFLRVLMATEAMTVAIHDSGFDRAAAAIYYNKAVREGVTDAELDQYRYSPKENWNKAQAAAKNQSDRLSAAGIKTTPSEQFISAIEHYQAMRPKEIQVSVYKAAGATALNTPATGIIGVASDSIQQMLKIVDNVPVLSKIKYLTAFTNSIAVQMGNAIEYTPFGAVGLLKNDVLNRTHMERSMMISGAVTGTAAAAAIALHAIANLDLPEDQRLWDITGMYSTNKGTRDAYTQAGGKLFSIRIGKTYIPFGETPFVLLLGGVAAAVDRVRQGKDPDPDTAMAISHSGFTIISSMLGGLGTMSMLKGITDVAEAINAGLQEKTGADVKLARILSNTVKGFVPAASLLRTIARYTDNPVDAQKDFASALVEGMPGLQSAFGRPSLNIFGEKLLSDTNNKTLQLHRVFSTKSSDVDMRWLSDNGYSVPGISNMKFSKELQNYTKKNIPDEQLEYDTKYKVFERSAGQIRDTVGKYRQKFGTSTKTALIQKAMNADIRRILASNSAKVVLGK